MPKQQEPDAPKPRISVLDRRLQNPFGEPSSPIDLKDRSLGCRWFNGAISGDHNWRAKQVKGWAIVTPEMVVDMDQIGGALVNASNQITRGARGEEVLMCMPKEAMQQIQWAKTRENLKNMGNADAQKRELVDAAGKALGDDAASFLNQRVKAVGGVQDSYERIERTPES